ncbi:unnamed protein product, partial [Mesorhabditis belari]|uniref:Uncharacterized protein n=1 Tax=Mesorhabditis belari TaxID=2138241 RepID=A0AAF3JC08_9BILA
MLQKYFYESVQRFDLDFVPLRYVHDVTLFQFFRYLHSLAFEWIIAVYMGRAIHNLQTQGDIEVRIFEIPPDGDITDKLYALWRLADEQNSFSSYRKHFKARDRDKDGLRMVLRSGNLKRKDDQRVLCIAYHIRKLAVALTGKAGHEVVVFNIDTGAPAFRKATPTKVKHIQWKSNSSMFLITEDYTLLEICIATGKIETTQLTSEHLKDRQWEITAGAVWRKGEGRQDQGLAVAVAVKCDRDILKSAIKAGSDLYGKHRKRKAKRGEDKYNEDGEEIKEEPASEDEEFEEKVALLTWHLTPERKIEAKLSAFFEDCHSQPVHSMLFSDNLLLTGGEDGLVNVLDVNEVDEDEAIQTTVMADSSISKVSPLKNGFFGIITDDNKQLLIRKNAADDFDVLHKRVMKRGHFLIDLVPGKDDEKPVAAVEADSRGEVTITAFDEAGKNAELLVRSYTHPDLIQYVSAQGNVVCAVDCEANWSAYNITHAEGNIADEKPIEENAEGEMKPRFFNKDRFNGGRGGVHQHNFNENRVQKEPGIVSFEDDTTTQQRGQDPYRNFPQRRQFNDRGRGNGGNHRGFNRFNRDDQRGGGARERGHFKVGQHRESNGNDEYGHEGGFRNFGQNREFNENYGPPRDRGGFKKFGQKRGGFTRGRGGGGGADRKPSTLGGGRYKPY